MKICIVCGSITDGKDGCCPYCKNEDLRVVESLKIRMGMFEGKYEYSKEEMKFLKALNGVEVVKEK